MLKSHQSRVRTPRSPHAADTIRIEADVAVATSPIDGDDEHWCDFGRYPTQDSARHVKKRKWHKLKKPKKLHLHPQGQQHHPDPNKQQQKKKDKKQAIVGFFKRMKLRPLWRRSRSRSRGRRRPRGSSSSPPPPGSPDEIDAVQFFIVHVRPGTLELCSRPPTKSLISVTASASFSLDAWSSPYDFAVQGDRLFVPGLDVAQYSLNGDSARHRWPASLGRFVPLCIDTTPGLVYLTAASTSQCGLFVFDRSGCLAASRLETPLEESSPYNLRNKEQRRPGMFAVRVNFRGECWVTNPRDLCVDHYTAALRKIRSIDVARFGVPYYLTAHSYRYACLWVSFPETRRVVKFDWLTLEPLCHLAYAPGQSPCGLHLDEWGEQLYVTDIGCGRVLVYHAATMGLADESTRTANAALTGRGDRLAAVRLSGSRLMLLSCSASSDRCSIDVYALTFR